MVTLPEFQRSHAAPLGETPTPADQTTKDSRFSHGAYLAGREAVDIHTSPLGWKVIGAAIEVHKTLGPGLLESAYERPLAREFTLRDLAFRKQVVVPATYKGENLNGVYRVDFVVENELVVELKASSQLAQVHRAQLRTYLRLLGIRQGLILNFNLPRLVDGLVSVLLPDRPVSPRQ